MSSTQPKPTPAKVLTKSQQKKAVRSKTPRTKRVLFNPFRLAWPTVPRGDAAAVLSALTSCLPHLEIVTAVPQQEYRRLLEAGDRAAITAARQRVRQTAAPLLKQRRRLLDDCAVGFNAASRALEQSELAALLVEAETPALETVFLAPLAAGRQCRAVCIHRLRPTLHACVGISTTVLGLTHAVKEKGHHLNPLYLAVCAAAPCADPPVTAQKTADISGGEGVAAPNTDQKPTDSASEDDQSSDEDTVDETATQPKRDLSPIPFDQADFISLAGPTERRAPPQRSQVQAQVDCLMSIDTVGVPHKLRPLLQAAKVMQVTLGDKTEKRKRRKAARVAKKQRTEEQ